MTSLSPPDFDESASDESGWRWRTGLALLTLAIVVRVFVAAGLNRMTHGQAMTDDQAFMFALIDHPLQILLARDEGGPQFWPPLFPFLSSGVARGYRLFLNDFLTLRAMSITAEMAGFPLLWVAVCRTRLSRPMKRAVGLLYALLPVAVATTAMFAQDEAFSMFAIGLVMLLVWRERYFSACLLCGLSAAAVKIYFLVPLAVLVFTAPPFRPVEVLKRGLLGLLGVGPLYAITFYNQHRAIAALSARPGGAGDMAITLENFASTGQQGVTLWTLVQQFQDIPAVRLKYVSGLCALASVMIPVAAVVLTRRTLSPRQVLALIAASLLGTFFWFMHCDPEYYLIPLPLLFGLLRPAALLGLTGVGYAFVYVVNFAYGVGYAKANGVTQGGKAVFIRLYDRFVPIDTGTLHALALVVVLVANAITVAMLLRIVFGRETTSMVETNAEEDSVRHAPDQAIA